MFRTLTLCLLSLYIGAGAVFAQADDAAALFQQQKWPEAAKAYRELLKSDSTNGNNWYQLAYAEHVSGNPDAAIPAYLKADELGFAQGFTRYNLACAYSLTGNVDAGFDWLEKVFAVGFSQGNSLDTDPDLASLRADSRWSEFRQKMEKKIHPCEFDERYRQLDFWVENWGLYLTDGGAQAGTTKVEKLESGCLIRESFTGVYGYTGTSISFFDPATGKWTQTWTNDHGNVNHFVGELRDGAMHLEGLMYPYNAEPLPIHMTLTPNPDGTIHLLTQISRDGGKTWEVRFDAVYRKLAEE
jgi:hypothetical protein